MPIKQLVTHFDKVGDHWRVKPALREDVRFERANLLGDLSTLGQFDVIFCRNVLIYFDTDGRRRVMNQLSQAIQPDGALYLGGAETITGVSNAFMPIEDARGAYMPVTRPAAHAAKSA